MLSANQANNHNGVGIRLSCFLQQAVENSNETTIIITPDTATANRIGYELAFFQPKKDYPILFFPDWETLPYDYFSPHQDIISERLAVLHQLPFKQKSVVILSAATLMQRVCPAEYLAAHVFLFKKGDIVQLDKLRERLSSAGYHAVSEVREHGEFAIRGSIIDLFPMGARTPYRIDLLDDEIDSIRIFSAETQRSLEKINNIELLPAKEFPLTAEAIEYFRHQWRSQFTGNPLNCPLYQDISEGICTPGIEYYLPLFFKETAVLFDYFPKNCRIIPIGEIKEKAAEFWHEITLRYQQRSHDVTRPLLLPEQLFISPEELLSRLAALPVLPLPEEKSYFKEAALPHSMTELEKWLAEYHDRILFCAESLGRREVLLPLLNKLHVYPKYFTSWHDFLNDNEKYGIIVAALEEGFILKILRSHCSLNHFYSANA